MKKKKIAICGHFAINNKCYDGQTIKTHMVYDELLKRYEKIEIIDTYGWRKHPFHLLKKTLKAAMYCSSIIIMPAQNGVCVFCPLFALLKGVFSYKTHYIVIGGWLDEFVEQHRWIIPFLRNLTCIYVETVSMKQKLTDNINLRNVFVLPNFKDLEIMSESEINVCTQQHRYVFCTFSRVVKEKGIEDAVETIKRINLKLCGKVHCFLDIYGPIDNAYRDEFIEYMRNNPDDIHYRGSVSPKESVAILKRYDALLFPTYYEGEGFAGTLIDAYCAAIPVIASNWKYNAELVENGKTGYIFQTHNLDDFENKIIEFINCSDKRQLKLLCLKKAREYSPPNALRVLLNNMK